MMGLFDDLPSASEKSSGLFDDIPSQSAQRLSAVEPSNWIESQLAKITLPQAAEWGLNRARGFVMGMADPVVGTAQLAANLAQVGDPVNKAIAQKEAQYEAERKGVGSGGFDFARLGGNVASPVNLLAAQIPFATSALGRAGQGFGMGAAAGAMQPVTDEGNYAGQKALQTVAGGVMGGVSAPLLGKLGDAVLRRIDMVPGDIKGARATLEADMLMKKALEEVGQTINDLPPNTIATLRSQVVEALKNRQRLDAAATLRKMDFDATGIKPLQGQITRDPMQFAREQNLRGVANVGEPIAARLAEQNQSLQLGIGAYRSGAVDDAYLAGEQLRAALKSADNSIRGGVTAAYQKARADAGKDLNVPLQGLAQDVADVVSAFGNKVPSGVMNQFRALGIDPANPSNQKQLFTIESADKLLKVINDNVDSDLATNRALDKLREAVKNAVLSVDDTGGPFAPAVKAAAQRFRLLEAIPSLRAASEGTVAADDFVRRFVINGKAEEVAGMAKLLQAYDKPASEQARAQIGAHLHRAAFGENTTGDKTFAAERFNKAIREIGEQKLKAFFTPDEIARLKQLGRVGAYIHQAPPAAAVNYSNTGSAIMNLMNRVPGMPAAVSVAKSAKTAVDNAATVRTAVNPTPPIKPLQLAPEEARTLSDLLAIGAFATGGIGGGFAR